MFSAADIASFVVVSTASALGTPIPEGLPRFAAWSERVGARPADASVLADMRAPAAQLLAA